VERMSAGATHATARCIPPFPAVVDAGWETENRAVWNEQEHGSEEHELVYEINWIAELVHGGVFCDRSGRLRRSWLANRADSPIQPFAS
jgi:hypothetical protein